MCRTPEEAAWTLLSETAETREHRVISKILQQYGEPFVQVEIIPNIPRRTRTIRVTCDFLVTNELYDALAKEVEHEPTLVRGSKGSSSSS